MKIVRLFIICLVVPVLLISASSADVIGSFTVNTGTVGGREQGNWPWVANLWFTYGYSGLSPSLVLFNGQDTDDLFFGWEPGIDIPNNIGNTFWVASDQDDPEFSQVVNMLTSEEYVFGWINNSLDASYRIWLSDMMGDPGGPENLHGYTIERIGLRIDSAECIFNPSTSIYYHTATLTAIFEGYPTVPEPSSLLILISGIGGLCGVCRYRKKR